MSQQINLCSPILLTQKRYFSANTMAISLALFIGLGGVMTGAWVWNQGRATTGYKTNIQSRSREIENLQAAIQRGKDNAGPVDPALLKQLQDRKTAIQDREKLIETLKEGLMTPGMGHSDRLALLARTIPAPVWITAVSATSTKFEISGYTLEPAALNAWVDRLSASALMQGLVLSDVHVENATQVPVADTGKLGSPPPAVIPVVPAGRPVWSFHLVNSQPHSAVTAASTGGKP